MLYTQLKEAGRRYRAALCAIALGSVAGGAAAMSGHPDELPCDEPVNVGGAWQRTQCTFTQEPYIPPDVGWNYPVSFIYPRPLPENKSLKLKVFLHGYTGAPVGCESDDGATTGFFVINNCAAHYPNHNYHNDGQGRPMGWWGIFGGTNNNGFRIGLSITRAVVDYYDAIDLDAGIQFAGSSYGGTGSILQSMILPDPWWRRFVTVVHASVPHTLFVNSHYHLDPAVRLAWQDYDTEQASFRHNAEQGLLDHIYYRINGATNDPLGRVDLEFFDICDTHRIACYGTWHRGGHSAAEPGVHLPQSLYAGERQSVRLNRVLPVFTRSSANHGGERGHYNLGLSWETQGIVDQRTRLEVPLRYRRHTAIGGGIPDQPPSATFDLTLRRVKWFELPVGRRLNWALGTQVGSATVTEEGSLTLEGLTLATSQGFTRLVVTPQ